MLNIRPVSDLRNKFSEIEETVKRGQPVYLTKNGYGSMVVMSLEQYSALTENVEAKLDEADRAAAERFPVPELLHRAKAASDPLFPSECVREEGHVHPPVHAAVDLRRVDDRVAARVNDLDRVVRL